MKKKVHNRLAARVHDWEEIKSGTLIGRTKSIDDQHYHKPGSQNRNK